MEHKLRILIIGWFKFPFGSASASRVRTLAKGLLENGADVRVITKSRISFRPEDLDYTGSTTWKGIHYECVNQYEQPGRRWSFWERLSNHVGAIAKSWKRTKEIIKKGDCNVILAPLFVPACLIQCFMMIGWGGV